MHNYPTEQILGDPLQGCMHREFEMSMMRELYYFLELQIKQSKEEIFINQAKYFKDLLKKFGMEDAKTLCTSMNTLTKTKMKLSIMRW